MSHFKADAHFQQSRPSPNDARFDAVVMAITSDLGVLEDILSACGYQDTSRGLIATPGSVLSDNLCYWARKIFPDLKPCTDAEILEYWHEIGERIDFVLAEVESDIDAPVD